MSDTHSEGIRVSKFCALRTEKCSDPCKSNPPNEYRKNAEPSWVKYTFLQGKKKRINKEYEAHHLLCVACVTELLGKNKTLTAVIEQTEWCINATNNMLGMPVWGHTISWYCDLAEKGKLIDGKDAPAFQNLPQHDYDHNSKDGYTKEVKDALDKLAKKIKKSVDVHENISQALKDELDALSSEYREKLIERGSVRCLGTHSAWQTGSAKPHSDWYLPFSMADDDNVEPRTFPAPNMDSKMAKKIKRLAAALMGMT